MNSEFVLSSDLLISQAAKLEVSLTATQARQIIEYIQMLIEYDKHTNLVGNSDPECLFREHILDSLALLPIMDKLGAKHKEPKAFAADNLIDIGSGAGFPGLVLVLGKSNLCLTIVEATGKKVQFLKAVAQALDVEQRVEIINARAEDLARSADYRGSFNYATCRAMGNLGLVCEISLPFLTPGGYAILQRGAKNLETEQHLAKEQLGKLGGSLVESILLDRQLLGKEHYVLLVKQNMACPNKFPRVWKDIKAKPLF